MEPAPSTPIRVSPGSISYRPSNRGARFC